MGFLDNAADSGLLGGLTSFGQGFLGGMRDAEDRKMKRMEFEAKNKASDWEKEKKSLEQQIDTKKRNFDQAGKLRDDWLKNQTTKNSQTIKESYDKIQGAARNPSPAGDMSLIFGYMKMLDPGSTVREGEFANAQNATGVPGQITNMYNKIMKGERLNPQQRADFIKQSQNIYSAQQRSQGSLDEQFGGLSDTYGIPREEVVLKIFTDPQTGEQKVVPVQAPKSAAPAAKPQGLVKPKPRDNLDSLSDAELERLYIKKMGGK